MNVPFTASPSTSCTYSDFFRRINDDLVHLGGTHCGVRRIVCECSRAHCTAALEITVEEYEAVRAHSTRFFVAPGHELANLQRVLTHKRRVSVIQESQQCVASRPSLPNDRVGRNGQQPLVLIVDDDPLIRTLCSASLEQEGIAALEAADGRRGLEQARLDRPDLVVTNVTMPELDGFQLAQALRRDDRTHRIPLIFLTGETEVEAEARALELGALAYMRKPIEPTAFALLVTDVLARFARRNGPSLVTALRRAATATSVEPRTAA
jgi:PleD family two-component response regulator